MDTEFDRLFQPGPTDRIATVGTSGSGKTIFNRRLVRDWPFLFVVDPKDEFLLDNARYCATPRDIDRLDLRDPAPVIYAPIDNKLRTPEAYDNFFEWIFRHEHCSLYIDEINAVMRSGYPPPGLLKCWTMGRSRHIRCAISTQRPAGIPLVTLTEARRFAIFELQLDDDRKRMAEIARLRNLPELDAKYNFWWYNADRPKDGLREFRLNLGGDESP